MIGHPLAVWRRFALPYADPAYCPDWKPEDRPAWPGVAPSALFRGWIAERLCELEAKAQDDFEQSILHHFDGARPTPEQAFKKVLVMLPPEAQGQFLSELHIAQRLETEPLAIVRQMLRFDEPPRRGPTAIPELRDIKPSGLAGWDIWMLRKVILPRFWPEEATVEFHLREGELAMVAASRHGCTPKQAERFYVDEGLAGIQFERFADK